MAGASGSNGGKLLQLAQSMASKQLDGATSGEGEPVSALLLYHSILQVRSASQDIFATYQEGRIWCHSRIFSRGVLQRIVTLQSCWSRQGMAN